MYFYWRIQQDLSCLGEFLIFHDPSFNRCFRKWLKRNAAGIAWAEEWHSDSADKSRLN